MESCFISVTFIADTKPRCTNADQRISDIFRESETIATTLTDAVFAAPPQGTVKHLAIQPLDHAQCKASRICLLYF